MSNTLRQARILSSENDASVKQEQSTNVNIKITPKPSVPPVGYPSVPPVGYPSVPSNQVNFTPPTIPPTTPPPTIPPTYPSVPETVSRGVTDMGTSLTTLEKKNKFLELIVAMYETNPLKVNSYVVCESKVLMSMIKLLTDAEKVELVIDESEVGCGCSAVSNKFIRIDKILVYKNGITEDLKYGYNDVYTQFIRYGISLKVVV